MLCYNRLNLIKKSQVTNCKIAAVHGLGLLFWYYLSKLRAGWC